MGLRISEEHWQKVFTACSINLFITGSNWGRRWERKTCLYLWGRDSGERIHNYNLIKKLIYSFIAIRPGEQSLLKGMGGAGVLVILVRGVNCRFRTWSSCSLTCAYKPLIHSLYLLLSVMTTLTSCLVDLGVFIFNVSRCTEENCTVGVHPSSLAELFGAPNLP